MNRFKKWIKRRESKKDPLDIMLRLYAHEEDVMDELEEVRLSPDFTNPIRNDLEFYLPELCSFCLYEDFDDEILKFIIIASQSNLYFSHRVLFLKMIELDSDDVKEKFQNTLMSLAKVESLENTQVEKAKTLDGDVERIIEEY